MSPVGSSMSTVKPVTSRSFSGGIPQNAALPALCFALVIASLANPVGFLKLGDDVPQFLSLLKLSALDISGLSCGSTQIVSPTVGASTNNRLFDSNPAGT